MATATTDTLDTASLRALLGPQLTADQASLIFQQGQEAVVFALLCLAKQLAEKQPTATTPDPSAPSGQTPPYAKPPAKGRAKPRGARIGHPGSSSPDAASNRCSRGSHPRRLPQLPRAGQTLVEPSRTRIIEDIPADITPVVTEHTIASLLVPRLSDHRRAGRARRLARLV